MIKHLLCATDFSENAHTAVMYAAMLAEDTGAKLILFHAYHNVGPVISSKEIMTTQVHHPDRGAKAQENMQLLLNELETRHPMLEISTIVKEVTIVHGLLTNIQSNPVDMVVMGSQGWNRLKEAFFGGSVKDAIHELPCPVLAIPPGTTYEQPGCIFFASDLEEKDVKVVNALSKLAGVFDAEIIVGHFFPEENMIYQQDADVFKKVLKEEVKYKKLSLTSQTYGNLADYIKGEVKKRKADVLVLREREHGFIRDLFHNDLAEKFIDETDVPLLIFNDLRLAQNIPAS